METRKIGREEPRAIDKIREAKEISNIKIGENLAKNAIRYFWVALVATLGIIVVSGLGWLNLPEVVLKWLAISILAQAAGVLIALIRKVL